MEESPLHQFELQRWVPISIGGLDLSINKAVVFMWVVIAVAAVLMVMAGSSRKLVPGKLQSLAEMMVDFIRTMIMETMGKDGMRFFPLVATLFVFILFSNYIGLIPGAYTVTSQIIVTAAFSFLVYGISLVVGFSIHGVKFLGILIPPGTPGWLVPLMVPIEIISQIARPISLAVRLFANMTAGLTISGGLLIGWLPFVFTVAIYLLEFGIAFIQAYIFTILTCVYLGDAFHLHGHEEHAH
jgi:F-type H+-transporting ATPase subunit a